MYILLEYGYSAKTETSKPVHCTLSMSDPLLSKLKQVPEPGDIFWLLNSKDVDRNLRQTIPIRDKAFNHPVLVLSADHRTNTAGVFIVRHCVYRLLNVANLFSLLHLAVGICSNIPTCTRAPLGKLQKFALTIYRSRLLQYTLMMDLYYA